MRGLARRWFLFLNSGTRKISEANNPYQQEHSYKDCNNDTVEQAFKQYGRNNKHHT